MPVRSSNSSVLKWPDRAQVEQAARAWAEEVAGARSDVLRIGFFGSYARGDWGVGSDLDLVAVVTDSEEPFTRRSAAFDLLSLPVPADLLVYTLAEWERLQAEGGRFARMLGAETVWVFRRTA
ncbi:MAG: nucleotidyltransferase domain-containing protein [Actinobacteria bacterium]|nr:nucleotidyltransferase domain-containing protein [Actinomycetota bacterium]